MGKLRILLTGGGGMVGRNILEHRSLQAFEVLAPRSLDLDLCCFDAVLGYLKTHKPDMVVHCAGKVGGIQANMLAPVKFLMDNLDMGRNIVWAAQRAGIKRLINLGSSCMYPADHSDQLSEEMLLTGGLEATNEGYALAKIVTARLCDYIMREDSTYQYKTLIPCNLYGRYDKFDTANSHLVPAIIHKIHAAIKNREQTVSIWGDGTARREFMYAGDLADAIMRAVDHFDTLPAYMNLGLGHDYTIDDYYRYAAEVMGYGGEFVHDLSRPVGMARKLVSICRQHEWGWSASHDLRNGIEKTYNYYLNEYRK